MGTLATIERAFQIARSGAVTSVPDIDRILRREGLWDMAIDGPTIRRQLTRLIKESRATREIAGRSET
jgi:hypothetical protein